MKSVATSTILHAVVLTWGLWSLSSPEPLDMGGEALPVSLVPISEYSEATLGAKDAPKAETSAPTPTKTPEKLPMPAENVGDNEVDLKSPPQPKTAPRETIKTAAAETPPPPAPAVEPTPEPTPEPEPTPVAEAPTPEPTPIETPPTINELAQLPAEPTEPTPPAPPKNVPRPQAKPKPPEPVKVAEAKPEPTPVKEPAKEKPKTPDKSKDKPKPDTQKSEEKQFDADAIAALLNKSDSAGGGAKRSTQTAALGATKQTGGTLSQSEMDALRGQISKCWNPPAGNADAGSFRVKISMQLDQSGELQSVPQIVSGGGASMAERAASEAAVRAVRRCAPYNLPAEKYETWADVTVNFDPSQMF